MFVKINTKEHFSILNVTTPVIHANMAEELREVILRVRAAPPHNIIMDLRDVSAVDKPVIEAFLKVQEVCLAEKTSFVLTEISSSLKEEFNGHALNTAPAMTEAVDLVMMEQLEREL